MWKKLVAMFALFLAVGGEVVLAQPAFVRELTVVAAAPGANPAAEPKHRRTHRRRRRRHRRHHR